MSYAISVNVKEVSCTVSCMVSCMVYLGTLSSLGLLTTPVFLIRSIDVLMDRTRTTVNVIGICTATVARTKWENAFDEEKAREFSNKI